MNLDQIKFLILRKEPEKIHNSNITNKLGYYDQSAVISFKIQYFFNYLFHIEPMSKESKLPAKINENIFVAIIPEYRDGVNLSDQAIEAIDIEILDNMEKKEKLTAGGLIFSDGGHFEKSVNVAGRVSVRGPVRTKTLSAAGSILFKDLVIIEQTASIAGKTKLFGNVIIGGKAKISGATTFDRNLVASGKLEINGVSRVGEHVLLDAPLIINGKLSCQSIRSVDKIEIDGRISVEEDVVAREINITKASGFIGGNIRTNKLIARNELAGSRRVKINGVSGIFGYIKDVLMKSISMTGKRLQIQGDIIADEVEISDLDVHGDIYANFVTIGSNVKITGTIFYQKEVSLPEKSSIKTIEQGAQEINHSSDKQ